MSEVQDDQHWLESYDTSRQHLGQVYAKALIGAADKAGNRPLVLEELESFYSDVFCRLPRLAAALSSPRIAFAEKVRLLDQGFGGKMCRELLNFLKVTARHGRLDCLREILRAARELDNQLSGRVEVRLKTAQPVEANALEAIRQRLAQSLRLDVLLRASVDESLIGGLTVQVGDTVYDGSVRTKLSRLRDVTRTRVGEAVRSIGRFLDEESAAGGEDS